MPTSCKVFPRSRAHASEENGRAAPDALFQRVAQRLARRRHPRPRKVRRETTGRDGINAAARASFFFMPCQNSSVSFFSSCARPSSRAIHRSAREWWRAAKKLHATDEGEMFARGQVVEDARDFPVTRRCDASLRGPRRGRSCPRENADRAALGASRPVNIFDGSGFARAVRAKKP